MAVTYSITKYGDIFHVIINETSVGDDSVAIITTDPATGLGLPISGVVLRQDCVLLAGTGTTVDPVLTRAPDTTPLPPDVVCQNATAAASVSTEGRATYFATITTDNGGTLYHYSKVNNAALDHTVTTEYIIQALP